MKLIVIRFCKRCCRIGNIGRTTSRDNAWWRCLIFFSWTWFTTFRWFRCSVKICPNKRRKFALMRICSLIFFTFAFDSSIKIIIKMSFICFWISKTREENKVDYFFVEKFQLTFDWHDRYSHESLWQTEEKNKIFCLEIFTRDRFNLLDYCQFSV